jgi:hypothetical protein
MEAWLTSVIAVAGTLLGATTTHLFQRSHAARAEKFARAERLRRERIEAYSAFAQTVTELRRGVISLWFHRRREQDSSDPTLRASYTEADRLGAAAAHAQFRVQLVADDPDIVELANVAFAPITALSEASDRMALAAAEDESERSLQVFVKAAITQLR